MFDVDSVPVYYQPEAEDLDNLAEIASSIGCSLEVYLLYQLLLKLNNNVFITR